MGLHNQVADMAKIYVLVLPFWSLPKHSFLYTFAGLPSLLALGLTHLHAESLLSNRDFDPTHRTRRSKLGQQCDDIERYQGPRLSSTADKISARPRSSSFSLPGVRHTHAAR